jgi:hypothetical protein
MLLNRLGFGRSTVSHSRAIIVASSQLCKFWMAIITDFQKIGDVQGEPE